MAAKDFTRQILHWAQQQELIRQVVMTGDRVNKAAVKKPLQTYSWIVSAQDPRQIKETFLWEQVIDERPVHQASWQENHNQIYALFSDRSRISLTILSLEGLEELLRRDTLCEVLLDKDARYGARPKPTDLSHRTRKPEEREYRLWCDRFFYEVVDAAMSLEQDEMIPAQFALARARRWLLRMTEAGAASTADFSINLGVDGKNLKAYLDASCYEHFLNAFAFSKMDSIWNSLFQSCVLFRKMGLLVGEKCGYEYPKRADVEILQMLRQIWEERH
ncbi:MAG: aminoglycoside 6-adenylyltransferase [Ndongobacter sp.]|nr:aminoglycoside 6-adenylyltransferase [Ndongobacter sp.]